MLAVAPQLLEAIRFNNRQGQWGVYLAMIMPDHVHLLMGFPATENFVHMVRLWKHWTARHLGVTWQRDFFDHCLRREESLREKAEYILQNPVRARLV